MSIDNYYTAMINIIRPNPGEVITCEYCRSSNHDEDMKGVTWYGTMKSGNIICGKCLEKQSFNNNEVFK